MTSIVQLGLLEIEHPFLLTSIKNKSYALMFAKILTLIDLRLHLYISSMSKKDVWYVIIYIS